MTTPVIRWLYCAWLGNKYVFSRFYSILRIQTRAHQRQTCSEAVHRYKGQGHDRNRVYGSSMVDMGTLSNNMMPPSPECYTTFWRMTICSDTIHWSDSTPTCDRVTELDLIIEFDFYPIARDFQRTFATDVVCRQMTLTPPDTLSCPYRDLHMF